MRRFYGFLLLIISTLLIIVCGFNPQKEKINSGLEYEGGYETLYKVDLGSDNNNINDIGKTVVSRIEDAGVENASVSVEKSSDGDENFIRIKMNAETETDLDYVLRSVEATGKITVSTLLSNDADYSLEMEEPFVIGSASVEWNSSTPYVSVDLKDAKEFKKFVDTCNSAYKKFMEKYNSDSEDTNSITGVMVLWLDKTENDSYVEAYQDTETLRQEEIRSKILALVPTDNFTYTEDSNGDYQDATFKISAYDYTQTEMVAKSAHTVERIINYGSSTYSMKRLYTQRIEASEGNAYTNIIIYGIIGASLVALIYLVVRFRLAGLAAFTSILLSLFMQLILFNFFGYTFTTMVSLGFLASLIMNTSYAIVYLTKFKSELQNGKSAIKANQQATKSTLVNLIDVTVLGLFVTIIALNAVSSQTKLFPAVLLIGTCVSLIVNRLYTLFAMYWLTHNKLASEKLSIFGVKANKQSVLDEKTTKVINKVDPVKNLKRNSIIATVISGLCVILIAVFVIIPSSNVFNVSSDSKTYTRIEMSSYVDNSSGHYMFEKSEEVKSFFNNNYPSIANKIYTIDINVVEDVLPEAEDYTTVQKHDVAYVSVAFNTTLTTSEIEQINDSNLISTIQAKTNYSGADYQVTAAIVEVNSSSVNYLTTSAIIVVSLFAGLSIVFVLVRYGLTYGLSTLVTLIPTSLIAISFYVASRIGMSALSLTGIAAGLIVVMIIQIPLYEKNKVLLRENKIKVGTYEQRAIIANQVLTSETRSISVITLLALVSTFVVAFASPLTSSVFSTYGAMAITIFVGYIATIMLALPCQLFFFKHIHFSFSINREKINRKKMEEAKLKNKNPGSEAREAIIPGIND